MGDENRRNSKFRRGTIVAITAEMIYQLTGSNMSSPQTAHLNAKARSGTINFWVRLTHWEAVAWTLFFWWLYGSAWALLGGGLAWSGMYGKYRYAIHAGLTGKTFGDDDKPTEDYLFKSPPIRPRGL